MNQNLDVLKIINESIEATILEDEIERQANEPVATDASKKSPIIENNVENEEEEEGFVTPLDALSSAIAPAISAGLGALTLRNRLRSLG